MYMRFEQSKVAAHGPGPFRVLPVTTVDGLHDERIRGERGLCLFGLLCGGSLRRKVGFCLRAVLLDEPSLDSQSIIGQILATAVAHLFCPNAAPAFIPVALNDCTPLARRIDSNSDFHFIV